MYRPLQLFLLTLSMLSVCVRVADAQEGLAPGARVRITAERWSWERTEARLVASEGDTLVLKRRGASEVRLPITDIERLEVSTRPRRSGAYALRGALMGAALASLGAKVAFDAKYRDDRYNTLAALVIGGPAGALVGSGIGYSLGEERWDPVPLRRGQ